MSFFFNATATTEIYTLSLHDALPISDYGGRRRFPALVSGRFPELTLPNSAASSIAEAMGDGTRQAGKRSEEHTSELQSLAYLVCRLLLEKKNDPSTATRRLLPNDLST